MKNLISEVDLAVIIEKLKQVDACEADLIAREEGILCDDNYSQLRYEHQLALHDSELEAVAGGFEDFTTGKRSTSIWSGCRSTLRFDCKRSFFLDD